MPTSAFVIGSIGRLTEEKGYNTLIDAFSKIARKHPDVYLLLIGSGTLEVELRSKRNQQEFLLNVFLPVRALI